MFKHLSSRLSLCRLRTASFSTQSLATRTPSVPRRISISESLSFQIKPDGLQIAIDGTTAYTLSHHTTRENCRCHTCTIHPSRHRKVISATLSTHATSFQDIHIKHADINPITKQINVSWSDGHVGYLDLDELFNEDDSNPVHTATFPPYQTWNTQPHSMNDYSFTDIMQNDQILYDEFYVELQRNGICTIRDSPISEETCVFLGERIANHIYPTIFGNSFIVEVVANTYNPAYTNIELATHTDAPYFDLPPAYFIFHCLENENVSTGHSIYNDGFRIAEEMRLCYPEQFEVLSRVAVPFRDHQRGRWDLMTKKHVIEMSERNETKEYVDKVHYNEGVRASLHWKEAETVQRDVLYAMSVFGQMTMDEEFVFERENRKGDIVVFDNTRVLHGRRAFEGARKVSGCYVTRQGINAVRKALKLKLHPVVELET